MLEAREAMGGTWDLFRYPGVRSDSDMFTLGYQFKPWTAEKSIADAETILDYIHETAAEFGVEKHIRYRTKVVGADWSTEDARWTLRARDARRTGHDDVRLPLRLRRLLRLRPRAHPGVPRDRGLRPGEVVHPQFWPEDLTYDDQRVVVIGSGATAVTLVPAMAERAAHVTMLQRSPTWIGAIPGATSSPTRCARSCRRGWRTGSSARRTSCSRWGSTTSASASPSVRASSLLGTDRTQLR